MTQLRRTHRVRRLVSPHNFTRDKHVAQPHASRRRRREKLSPINDAAISGSLSSHSVGLIQTGYLQSTRRGPGPVWIVAGTRRPQEVARSSESAQSRARRFRRRNSQKNAPLSYSCRKPLRSWMESGVQKMPYTIVFETRNTRELSAADATTANQALAIIAALQRANEEIKFIRSPQEGDIGVEMVRVLAKEEEEEYP